MAYSRSLETLEALRPTLAVLEAGRECEWDLTKYPSVQPQQFAYRIREALHIARAHPERYPILAEIAARVAIKVEGRMVRAVLSAAHKMNKSVPLPTQGGRELSEISAQSGKEAIMAAWSVSANRKTPLVFQHTALSAGEMAELYEWAVAKDLVLLPDGERLTVALATDDTREFAWTPDDGWPLT